MLWLLTVLPAGKLLILLRHLLLALLRLLRLMGLMGVMQVIGLMGAAAAGVGDGNGVAG